MTQKFLIFGGTSEGRQVSAYLSSRHISHTVCVATEYGEEVLPPAPELELRQGRMDEDAMRSFLAENEFALVIDATHPYAQEVSRNIRAACEVSGLPYLRYLRPAGAADFSGEIVTVGSAEEAADWLEKRKGNIFLTTGSRELPVFTGRISDVSRIFARVLPSGEVLEACRDLGLKGGQICAMQGPFSEELNESMLRQFKADFLVTKDSGKAGGFPEKLKAAERCKVTTVLIARPEEQGEDWYEVKEKIDEILGERSAKRQIACVGIGMGTEDTLTAEAKKAIRSAEVLFGAERMLNSARILLDDPTDIDFVPLYRGEEIRGWLDAHPPVKNAAILMSGDVGFYSGARKLRDAFPGDELKFICGISSVAYFASRIGTSWEDARLLSAHGKEIALLNEVRRSPKIFLLLGGARDAGKICGELHEAGMDRVRLTLGVNLSYPDEQILSGTPADFLKLETDGLHILLIENDEADFVLTPGIADECFTRGRVPMTKEEIRILSVSKLHLRENSVVYDVGAGTGSVACECARLCTGGSVYAIEQNPEGIALIRENARKIGLSNLIPVEGTAPDVLASLPQPTHAFIGGSSGNMRAIISCLREKNPAVRITVNTISMESIAALMDLISEWEIKDADIVELSAAKSRELGNYHMMTAHNPVYIVSFGGEK